MSNRHEAAARAAQIINDAEKAMDLAMSKASALVTELPSLQEEAGLNASWAQPVVTSLCSALTDMTTARGSIIAAHRSLSAIQRKLGLPSLEGPNNPKQPPEGGDYLPVGRDAARVVALRG
jgi:hypothetical protein